MHFMPDLMLQHKVRVGSPLGIHPGSRFGEEIVEQLKSSSAKINNGLDPKDNVQAWCHGVKFGCSEHIPLHCSSADISGHSGKIHRRLDAVM